MGGPIHGRNATYVNHKCRCTECVSAHAAAMKSYRERGRDGSQLEAENARLRAEIAELRAELARRPIGDLIFLRTPGTTLPASALTWELGTDEEMADHG